MRSFSSFSTITCLCWSRRNMSGKALNGKWWTCMDLEATIQLMEKPMGLLAILEEETMFPKSTDKSFEEKLKENLLGKSPVFLKKQPGSKDKNAHFAIAHYAGIVNYNLTNWF